MQIENHKNNFGFLRLLLATLVIVSHSPEILDHSRNRELLTNIFGTISLGELAVDGFFLISGYLILKSYLNSSTLKSYLFKRVLRIYPGFICASLFCIFVLIPFSGETKLIINMSLSDWLQSIFRMIALNPPLVSNTKYTDLHLALNGPMWTILYEFICYLCIPIVYAFPFNKSKTYLILIAMIMSIFLYTQITDKNIWHFGLDLHSISRFMAAFLIGGAFNLFKEKIIWSRLLTVASFILLLLCLNFDYCAEIGLFIFGSYLLFNFALNNKNKFLNSIGSKVDVSYGVYLYAWPIQIYIFKYYPEINVYVFMSITWVLSFAFGYLSWIAIEKPFMEVKKKLGIIDNNVYPSLVQ